MAARAGTAAGRLARAARRGAAAHQPPPLSAGRRGAAARPDPQAFSRSGNLNLISRKNFLGSSAHDHSRAQRAEIFQTPSLWLAGRRIKNFSSRLDSSSIFAENCTPVSYTHLTL